MKKKNNNKELNFGKKYAYLIISMYSNFFFIGVLMLFSKKLIIILLIVLFAHVIIYHIIFRCPKCKKNIFYNPIYIFGTKIWIMNVTFPDYCSKCGYKLRERHNK